MVKKSEMIRKRILSMLVSARLLTRETNSLIKDSSFQNQEVIFDALTYLQEVNLFNKKTIEILSHLDHAESIQAAFRHLQKAELLNQERAELILKNAVHAEGIAEAFNCLLGKKELNKKNVERILTHPEHAKGIKEAFRILQGSSDERFTQADVGAVLGHPPKHAVSIARALIVVKRRHLEIYRERILKNVEYVEITTSALSTLKNAKKLTENSAKAIFDDPKNALFYAESVGGKPLKDDKVVKRFLSIREVTRRLLVLRARGNKDDKGLKLYKNCIVKDLIPQISVYCDIPTESGEPSTFFSVSAADHIAQRTYNDALKDAQEAAMKKTVLDSPAKEEDAPEQESPIRVGVR